MATTVRPRVTGWVAHGISRLVRVRGLGRRASAVALALTTRLIVANAVAGLFVCIYLTITEEIPESKPDWVPVVVGNAVFYAIAIVLFSLTSIVRGKRVFAPAWTWLDSDSPPTPEQRRELLKQPGRMAMFPLRYWTAAAIISCVVRGALGSDAGQILVSGITVLEGGLVASLLGYLLGERALRPVFAEALGGELDEPVRSLGLGTRLVLAWALGSGLPLIGIILTPVVVPDAELGVVWAMVFLAAVGLVVGLTITVIAAKSITEPLAKVRAALAEIGAGDLTTTLVVDDGAEVGQLQTGVNEMVAGVRERARLEDLFGRHVGAGVARQAIAEGATLGGEVREISALFVDLRGSTELARRLPPVEVVALLNRFFDAVVRCCDAQGGWVDKFEGDAALCVFGAPDPQSDHATRALRTARALAAELAPLRARQPELDAGIGVATGDAVAGHIGTERRLEYTVIGEPVNTAARLTEAAKDRPGRVLAEEATIDAASDEERACWVPAASVDLKGLAPGLAVWEPAPVPSVP